MAKPFDLENRSFGSNGEAAVRPEELNPGERMRESASAMTNQFAVPQTDFVQQGNHRVGMVRCTDSAASCCRSSVSSRRR